MAGKVFNLKMGLPGTSSRPGVQLETVVLLAKNTLPVQVET